MLSAGDKRQHQQSNHRLFLNLDKSLWTSKPLNNHLLQGGASPDQTTGKDQLLNALHTQSAGSDLVIRGHVFKGRTEHWPDR